MPNDAFPWNRDDPLARVTRNGNGEDGMSGPGESRRSNIALNDYYAMGPGRSLRALHERYIGQDATGAQPEKPPTAYVSTLKTWSLRFNWQKRVARRVELDQAAFDDAMMERRIATVMADWDHGGKLRSLAEQILEAAPAFVRRRSRVTDAGEATVIGPGGEVVRQGRPREVVVTVALNSGDLARVEKLASDLQRAAAGIDGKAKVQQNLNVDPKDLTDDQLERLARGDDLLSVLALGSSD